MDTDDVAGLAAWIAAVAEGEIEPSAPIYLHPLTSFAEPDMAVRVLELDATTVKTRWYFQDETSAEDYSWELPNLRHARAFEITTTRRQLRVDPADLLADLARYPNR